MELEVKGNKFFILSAKVNKRRKFTLFNEIEHSMDKFHEYLKNNLKPEDMELMVVEIKGKKFEIRIINLNELVAILPKMIKSNLKEKQKKINDQIMKAQKSEKNKEEKKKE